jgi:Alternative complex III, ActD subunit
VTFKSGQSNFAGGVSGAKHWSQLRSKSAPITVLKLKEIIMAGKNTAVFGIYQDRATVESAVGMLQQAGFRNTDISVLFPYNEGTKDFAAQKNTKAPEGTAAGGGTGAVVGGTLGWLAGIGALAIPGLGPFIAAGPIMAALAGVGVGGAIGGITGALIGMGIPEYEAKRYEGRIKEGGILLSVHSDSSDWTKKAKEILERSGAQDVSSTGEASADFSKSDRPMPRAS